jgi:hypothetical protein
MPLLHTTLIGCCKERTNDASDLQILDFCVAAQSGQRNASNRISGKSSSRDRFLNAKAPYQPIRP